MTQYTNRISKKQTTGERISLLQKCNVCKKKFSKVKTIILLGSKGGIMTSKLCESDYREAEKRICKDILDFITVKDKRMES